MSQRVSDKITHAHVITCLSVRCLFLFCLLLPLPLAPLFSLSVYLFSVLLINFHVVGTAPTHTSSMAIYNPLTSYEPNLLDNFDYSETSAAIFQDETSSPLFTQEREKRANLRQACHSHEESLLPAQSIFAHTSTGTRKRIWFVSKTEIRSRHGRRKSQDSP